MLSFSSNKPKGTVREWNGFQMVRLEVGTEIVPNSYNRSPWLVRPGNCSPRLETKGNGYS